MSFANMGPTQVTARQTVAHAQTIDGRVVTVNHLRFNQPLAGVGSEGFAVDVGPNATNGALTVGFASYEDALRYITSSDSETFKVVDQFGNEYEETRVGLGIPDGMFRESKEAASLKRAPAVQPVAAVDAATHPVTAAVLNAPPDAADAPHANTTEENAERETRGARAAVESATVATDDADDTKSNTRRSRR